MPRVSAAFFSMGALFLLGGMFLGEYMGAHEDFLYAPVHAHMSLVGWVTPALYGTFYALTANTYSPRLAWANFLLSAVAAVAMTAILMLMFSTGDTKSYGPLSGAAGGVAILALLVFMVSVFRELTRKRA